MNIIKNKEGIALITVLLLLVVVGTLTSALMISYTSNISRAGDSAERNRAFYAAEAGANYLNDHINKNAKEKNIVFQPIMEGELRNLTGDLTNEFFDEFDSLDSDDFDDPIFKFGLADDIEINGFDLSFSFDESTLERNDEIYGFIIEASNGRISEKIRLIFEIETLPPFFRSSRQANKINIDNNSSFGSSGNFPAHSFATAEKYQYDLWEKNINYSKGDIIHYKGNSYIAKEDHLSQNNDFYVNRWGKIIRDRRNKWDSIELEEEPDLRKFNNLEGAVDYGMDVLPPQPPEQFWKRDTEYVKDEKVEHKGEFYISNVNNPQTEPGSSDEWQKYHNYKKQVVEAFDGLIGENEESIYSYSNPDPNDYENYKEYKTYVVGDIVSSNGNLYQRISREREKTDWFGNVYTYTSLEWAYYPKSAYEKFLLDNDSNNVGPYIKIDGDFKSYDNSNFYKDFSNMKTDENGIVHILVDGDVNMTNSNVFLKGDKKVILYVNGDLNFDRGVVSPGENFTLAYFAPNATFNINNSGGEFVSSMVVNELNITDSHIPAVTYDTEDSPLIGKMNPEIAELSRSFATQHGGGTVSQINPVRQSWEQIE